MIMKKMFSLTLLHLGANLTVDNLHCVSFLKQSNNNEAVLFVHLSLCPSATLLPAPQICILVLSMLVLSQAAQQESRLFTNNLS